MFMFMSVHARARRRGWRANLNGWGGRAGGIVALWIMVPCQGERAKAPGQRRARSCIWPARHFQLCSIQPVSSCKPARALLSLPGPIAQPVRPCPAHCRSGRVSVSISAHPQPDWPGSCVTTLQQERLCFGPHICSALGCFLLYSNSDCVSVSMIAARSLRNLAASAP
jgi:hypothetical protein